MNMTTNIDNIPMKTNTNDIPNDDSDDPIVKNILDEFQQELNNQKPIIPSIPHIKPYIVNSPVPAPIIITPNKFVNYINEDSIKKSAIIIIVVGLIFSPILFTTIIDKLPINMANIFTDYNFYIKLILVFIIIYILFYYNLL